MTRGPKKQIFVVPGWVTMHGKPEARTTTTGNLNRGRVHKFKTYSNAVKWAKAKGKRMGPGTKIMIHAARSERMRTYTVKKKRC